MNIRFQRCLVHEQREAVARCPRCRQFFCHECVTEHNQIFICASCLRKASVTIIAKPARTRWILLLFGTGAGVGAAWVFFYLLGMILLQIPADLHQALSSGGHGP